MQRYSELRKPAVPCFFNCFPDVAEFFQQFISLILIDFQFVHQHFCSAINELVVAQLHVNHLVVFHPAQLYHHSGGNHIQHQLLRSACFHACTSGHKFRTYNNLNRNVGRF